MYEKQEIDKTFFQVMYLSWLYIKNTYQEKWFGLTPTFSFYSVECRCN